MRYLFRYNNKYFDINNNEVVVKDNLVSQVELYGFDILQLLTLNKDKIINKQLVTCKEPSVNNFRLCIKNKSDRFILIKLDKEYENLYFKNGNKMLVSEDGINWRNYQDYNAYSKIYFNINLDNINADTLNINSKTKLFSMMDYIMYNCRKLNLINTKNIKYLFVEIEDLMDRICQQDEWNETIEERDLITTFSKNLIKVKNNSNVVLKQLNVKILKSSAVILDTLKEF